MGGRFEGRLARGIGGERGRPGFLELDMWFATGRREEEKWRTNDFNEREVMQVCAPCPNAWILLARVEKRRGERRGKGGESTKNNDQGCSVW